MTMTTMRGAFIRATITLAAAMALLVTLLAGSVHAPDTARAAPGTGHKPTPTPTTANPTATSAPTTANPTATPTASSTPTVAPTGTSSPTATPTPGNPTGMTLFSDGFESGTFAAWSPGVEIGRGGTATVQSGVVKSGTYAAQLSETATSQSVAFVRETFALAPTDLDASGDFDITAEGASGGNV